MTEFEKGLLLGILIGEGHFGGDGRQPQITVRMHTKHAQLFHTLVRLCPDSKLYGPYEHGGRSYYQWMVRGESLRQQLVPLLDDLPLEQTDTHVFERYMDMKQRYAL